MDEPIATISALDVTKTFSGPRGNSPVPALRSVSLTVRPGEMLAVVGPSGCGKSTLLYCLSGLESIDGGEIDVLGTNIKTASRSVTARLRRQHLGFVFQSYNLVPSLSAEDNVGLPLRLAGVRGFRDIALAALVNVGLDGKAKHMPAQLSGGEQQRVAIARVLATNPDVIFADEPTGALDSVTSDLVLERLRSRSDAGSTVVVVTHDLEAASRADRTLVMRDGTIVDELTKATPQAILDVLTRTSKDQRR